MLNVGNMLPRLSIRGKLITAFVGLSVVPAVFIGMYGLVSNIRTMRSIALSGLTHDVRTIRERGSNFLAGVESDLLVLRSSTHLVEYVHNQERPEIRPDPELLKNISADLLAFVRTKRIYFQLRLVNMDRDEVLRVECDNRGSSPAVCRVLPDSELRHGGEAYYFLLTQNLSPGKIAFSPAEVLYGGGGAIPVLSFAMPLAGDGKRDGLLIANVYASDLFAVMETERGFGADERVALVGDDGHYFYQSDTTRSWNLLIASREQNNLQNDFPAAVAQRILSPEEGTITDGTDDFIVHSPLFAEGVGEEPGLAARRFTESLYVFETVPAAMVMAQARTFAWTFGGFLVVFLTAAILLGMVATAHFTRSIAEVQAGADTIARGKYSYRLHVETHDEIEKLASQFNTMAAALETHEREIQQHRLQLEEMVDHRTAELAEEKSKLQAILDNVPSAFVLLDRAFRILTASASFTAVTGFSFEDVRGQDCRHVFGTNGFCCGPEDSREILAGRAASHVDTIGNGSAGGRFIEHTAIPIMEKGEVGAILEIFTDITKRKQLEQHLVQSEKLMATGEMAAIIAHEFRNALTSIKMILQLQQESKHLTKADRKSLGVALDSIYHMETVVRELLNFARPAPMEFKRENLGTLIDDCIAFARLRIHRQNIRVVKSVERSLPAVAVDAPHFKEALINLLLNAIQALESDVTRAGTAEISIDARRMQLTGTIVDFDSADLPVGGDPAWSSDRREIVLPAGSECVSITVSDNGPGIGSPDLRRVFDPFFTTKPNGTGLGLPMVKRTVNAHGGIVTVKSSTGGGASFGIILPVDQRGGRRVALPQQEHHHPPGEDPGA